MLINTVLNNYLLAETAEWIIGKYPERVSVRAVPVAAAEFVPANSEWRRPDDPGRQVREPPPRQVLHRAPPAPITIKPIEDRVHVKSRRAASSAGVPNRTSGGTRWSSPSAYSSVRRFTKSYSKLHSRQVSVSRCFNFSGFADTNPTFGTSSGLTDQRYAATLSVN